MRKKDISTSTFVLASSFLLPLSFYLFLSVSLQLPSSRFQKPYLTLTYCLFAFHYQILSNSRTDKLQISHYGVICCSGESLFRVLVPEVSCPFPRSFFCWSLVCSWPLLGRQSRGLFDLSTTLNTSSHLSLLNRPTSVSTSSATITWPLTVVRHRVGSAYDDPRRRVRHFR